MDSELTTTPTGRHTLPRVLIAGMGNVLRYDDGFGVELARRLLESDRLPAGACVIEVGIGGIHLVQALMDGYDVLVILDTVDRGSTPGTLHVLEAEAPDINEWSEAERSDFLADMHYTTPSKAITLARAMQVLPERTYIVGCQPEDVDGYGIGLTEPVQTALHGALDHVCDLIESVVDGR